MAIKVKAASIISKQASALGKLGGRPKKERLNKYENTKRTNAQ